MPFAQRTANEHAQEKAELRKQLAKMHHELIANSERDCTRALQQMRGR